jgi:hypothetical protein
MKEGPINPGQEESNPRERMWQSLILIHNSNFPLSQKDKNALMIREACFKIADYIEAAVEGSIKDGLHEAELVAGYWQGYQMLDDFNVKVNMHTSKSGRIKPIKDSLTMAEQMGGHWQKVRGKETSQAEALQSLQNIGETPYDCSDEMQMIGIESKNITPQIVNWMVMRDFVKINNYALAGHLGRPKLS